MGETLKIFNDETLDKVAYEAFSDEIEKIADKAGILKSIFNKITSPRVLAKSTLSPQNLSQGFAGNVARFVKQLNPIKGIPEGWRSMSGQYEPHIRSLRYDLQGKLGLLPKINDTSKVNSFWNKLLKKEVMPSKIPIGLNEATNKKVIMGARDLKERVNLVNQAQAAIKSGKELTPEMAEAWKATGGQGFSFLSRNFGDASKMHLLENPKGIINTIRGGGNIPVGLAEELSRSGWTGAGRITKYLPVGQKSLMTGFAASAVPQVLKKPEQPPSPTGEGGRFQKGLGFVGNNLGWVMGAPLGLIGSTGMFMGGEYLGDKAGRFIDRMRAGADPMTALKAPSPTEAQEQLENISQFYTPQYGQ